MWHEPRDLLEVLAEVAQVAAHEAEQEVLAGGLQGQAVERPRERLERVAAAAEERPIRGQRRLAVARCRRRRRSSRSTEGTYVAVEGALVQLAAEALAEPLQRRAAGVEHEEREPASGKDVRADVEVARRDGPIGAHVGDVAGAADDVDVARVGQAAGEGRQRGVVAAAEDRHVGRQAQLLGDGRQDLTRPGRRTASAGAAARRRGRRRRGPSAFQVRSCRPWRRGP